MTIDPKLPLRCIVRGGALVIEVGADTVKFATENHPDYWNDNTDSRHGGVVKVANKNKWLRSVVRAVNSEREDGSSLLSDMMDKAVADAIENGEEGLTYDD